MTAPSNENDLHRGVLRTDVARPLALALMAVFLLVVYGVPVGQMVVDAAAARPQHRPPLLAGNVDRKNLARIEKEIEGRASLRAVVQPHLQSWLTRFGGFGNVEAVVGRKGWLFYGPGLAAVAGPGYLDPRVQEVRRRAAGEADEAPVNPDPRPAILDFHRMLRARGIHLVILPVPDKVALQPFTLHRRFDTQESVPVVGNPHDAVIFGQLRAAGVTVLNARPPMVRRGDAARFLVQDTHWSPGWMEEVATALARVVAERLAPRSPVGWRRVARTVSRVGDVVDMLQLPAGQTLFRPQAVTIHQVQDPDGHAWRPRETADVLLLGDSFTNIFSAAPMGWGSAAGLGAQLAAALDRDVDVIARNDAGAHATRELLARELAAGRDRLAGKRVVVWQFAGRELAVGDWRPVRWPSLTGSTGRVLATGAPPHDPLNGRRRFFVPPPGGAVLVTAVVVQAAPVPRPGEVPYKDHVRALHLRGLSGPRGGDQETLAYVYSMRDNVWTAAARLLPGARVRVRLRPWSAVAAEVEAINRSELTDEALLDAEPVWAELEMNEEVP